MKTPPLPPNEAERLRALEQTRLLDTAAEDRFDRLTRIARRLFDVPIALITLVDHDRQWFKSCQGLTTPETPRAISFCGHAILHSELFVVNDAGEDERFRDNPLVTCEPHIRFYAGAPLHSDDGYRLGTLCVIDRKPREFDREQRMLLRDLAKNAEREISLRQSAETYQRLRQSERRARAAIEGTRVGTWQWNIQTGETVFNERWAEICGYTLSELEPVDIQTWLNLAHPDDLEESEARLNAHFEGATDEYDCRCRMRHKNGQWVWVHDRGRVFEWTADGSPLMMYGTHADITEEMQTLQRMEQQNRALGILNDLAINSDGSLNARVNRALTKAREFLDLPIAIVSEINGDAYTIRWVEAPDAPDIIPGITLPVSQTFCSLLLEHGKHLAIEHMGNSRFRHHDCYRLQGLESYIAAPILVGGQLYGTLNLSSAEPHGKPFTETEITFVTLLAKWLASQIEPHMTSRILSKLAEQAPGVLYQYRQWPDGHSSFPFASTGMTDIYDVTPEQVVSDASVVFDQIHPEDLPKVSQTIQHSGEALEIWQCQYRVRHGEDWKWVEGRASPERLPDDSIMWHGYIVDIDDKKRTQLQLQESEEQLRRLFELSPIGIALTDYQSGEGLAVNEALLRPTGYNRDSFLALRLEDLIPEDFDTLQTEALEALRTTGRFGPFERNIARADTSTFPARVQGLLIHNSSGRSLIWTLVEDISERRKVEQMKNDFIATISHELRTPLTSIAGSLGLIAGGALGDLPDKVNRMIAIAARNSDQLRLLINDLLDMDKLVSGQMSMTLADHPAGPLLERVIEQLHTYSVERGVEVRLHQEPSVLIYTDAFRLQQALNNLLSNAIKFSPQGGIVDVLQSQHDGKLRIHVRDQGPGVPEDFQPRLFEKFAQAHSPDSQSRGGTGLGLAITREIMSQLGGQVGFQAEPGEGTVFWLEVPLAVPA